MSLGVSSQLCGRDRQETHMLRQDSLSRMQKERGKYPSFPHTVKISIPGDKVALNYLTASVALEKSWCKFFRVRFLISHFA